MLWPEAKFPARNGHEKEKAAEAAFPKRIKPVDGFLFCVFVVEGLIGCFVGNDPF
jgi:hypothetical protein